MRRYVIAALVAIPLVALLFVVSGYVHDEVTAKDHVSRGVEAAGVDLSRLPESTAVAAIASYETTLSSEPVIVVVEGKQVPIDPTSIDLAIDEQQVVEDAMTTRRHSGLVANFMSWMTSWASSKDVPVVVTWDEAALAEQLDEISITTINKPAYDGAVKIQGTRAVAEYPQAGLRINVEAALPLIASQVATTDRQPVEMPLVAIEPQVNKGDVDVAVVKANALIGEQVVLRRPGNPATLVFTPSGLASALRSKVFVNSPASVEVTLDQETLATIAESSAERFRIEPVDATFAFDDETKVLTVVPSIVGQRVDIEKVPGAVERAALGSGFGTLPMTDGAEAAFTTAMAIDMGPLGEVSTFTTVHPCCQSRVKNIQLLADEIRGAIVLPGETFSVNDRAGKRTLAEGYVRAGAIINGRVECCESSVNIGGGTSQFATTFYNTVFFGCYEDVFHQPHSLYFSRYPFVREATLGFPAPDVKFRNDSDAVVYIDTTYTSGSITVTFYGNNGGKTCTSERSGNTITRVMEWPNGATTTQSWTWNYRQPRKDDPPPVTTTSTTIPSATTTTVASTTTTTVVATTTTAPATTTTTATPTP
jgi:vancomycin resistance protein YoaR